jgi:hypothetical protein
MSEQLTDSIDIFDADQCQTALGKKLRQEKLPLNQEEVVDSDFESANEYLRETLAFIDDELPKI